MRYGLVVMGLLVAMAAAFALVIATPEPMGASGAVHPGIAGMRVGGDGAARYAPIAAPAIALQALTFVLVGALVAIAPPARRRTPAFWASLALSVLAALFVWWRMNATYARFLETGETRYLLGFPEPTFWAIFGVWGAGLLLVLVYVVGFRRFVLPPEDERAFAELVAETKRAREGR
ncbi:MAG: hypothetical protein H6923_01315 [Alphaproteobacteria bacterium]|nr:hypothetical protein [Alphaproteobacteria bacterium]